MDQNQLRETIVRYLKDNANVGPEGIGGDDRDLIEDGVIDSFGLLGLITFLEEQFKIRIDASEIDPAQFNSVKKISEVVTKAGLRSKM
jgi:acyl carrier protein